MHTEGTIADKRIVSEGCIGGITRTISLVKSDGKITQKGLAELLIDLQNGKSP